MDPEVSQWNKLSKTLKLSPPRRKIGTTKFFLPFLKKYPLILPFTHGFFAKLNHQNYGLSFASNQHRHGPIRKQLHMPCLQRLSSAAASTAQHSQPYKQPLRRPVQSVHIPIKVCSLLATQYNLLSSTFTTTRFPSPAQSCMHTRQQYGMYSDRKFLLISELLSKKRKKWFSFLTGAQDSHLQRVTIPEAAYIQLRRRPPEDEQSNARNM